MCGRQWALGLGCGVHTGCVVRSVTQCVWPLSRCSVKAAQSHVVDAGRHNLCVAWERKASQVTYQFRLNAMGERQFLPPAGSSVTSGTDGATGTGTTGTAAARRRQGRAGAGRLAAAGTTGTPGAGRAGPPGEEEAPPRGAAPGRPSPEPRRSRSGVRRCWAEATATRP